MNTNPTTLLKSLVNIPFNAFGLELIRKTKFGTRMPNWKERMHLAKKLGFSPLVVFDGGAFRGLWAKDIAGMFPDVQIVLFEPNPFVQSAIRSNISNIQPSPMLLAVALGESKGIASFNIRRKEASDTGASLLDHVSGQARKVIQVEVDTLDNISERLALSPNLIKLDLQGGELSALRGGTRVLRDAELVIIEFGCLEAYIDRATPRDILDIMYDNDYCLYDIVDCHYRPYDGAMTGGDFFFVKNSSVLRDYKGWE